MPVKGFSIYGLHLLGGRIDWFNLAKRLLFACFVYKTLLPARLDSDFYEEYRC
jgi:hypothetical protein